MSNLTMSPIERLAMTAALGCDFHEPAYGECSGCSPRAEQVWDEAVEEIVRRRMRAAFDEGMWAAYHAERDSMDGYEVANPYATEPEVHSPEHRAFMAQRKATR